MSVDAPKEVVLRFLQALEERDHDAIAALLAPDLRYTNVSMPTMTGGERVAALFRRALAGNRRFAVQLHNIAVDGDTVMTERTDVLMAGPMHMAFWVCGTFRVESGRITVWRDYFDWMDFTRGTLRGLAGIAVPALRPTLPVDVER